MAKLSYGCAGLVAVISGGSSGIGLATAEKLLLDGAKVYILGRSRARGEAAVVELAAKTGAQALFVACDVSKAASCKEAVAKIGEREKRDRKSVV